MKILLCVNSDIGRKNAIGFRFGKIVEELKNQGVDFDIIARANYSKEFYVKTPFYGNYLSRMFNGIRIYFLPFLDCRRIEIWIFDSFVLRTLKNKEVNFDMAHFGEYLSKSMKFLEEKGIKIALDIPIAHHNYALFLQNQGFKLDNKIKIKTPLYLNKAIELADLIVAPSEFVKQSLSMAGFSNKSIRIIPFGADIPQNFNEQDIGLRSRNKPLKFVFAGNVNYRKGINFLLEAWEKANLKDAELLICGRVYKSIRNEIKKYNNKNIKFLGFVNVAQYFREAHVFVFPTLLEGSSKAVYEAMSYGLPAITTFNAGSIIEDGKSGFIVPIGDSDILAEKMKYFYKNPDKIAEMGKNAFNEVKNYSWKKYGENIIGIYKKICFLKF